MFPVHSIPYLFFFPFTSALSPTPADVADHAGGIFAQGGASVDADFGGGGGGGGMYGWKEDEEPPPTLRQPMWMLLWQSYCHDIRKQP